MQHSDSNQNSGCKALLICPTRRMAGEIIPLLSQYLPRVSVAEAPNYPGRSALMETLGSQQIRLCLLDVVSDPERAMNLIGEIHAVDSSIQIVVLMSSSDPDCVLRCLRLGASEFLLEPFSGEQLRAVTDRLARLQPAGSAASNQAKVYCVMPAKGACGASTVACNLAYQFKRLGAKRILLADLDPLTGSVAFLLKLKSSYSFVDAVSRSGSLDADLWKGLVVAFNGVDVLLSPENPVDGISGAQDATALLAFLRQMYDVVILDSAGPYGDWNLTMARLCDDLLLVTTNELPVLQATQRVLSFLERNAVERSKIRLIVNRYFREVGLSKEMIETALHSDIYGLIPSDFDGVQKALLEGKLLPPGSTCGKALTQLADKLAGREEAPEKKRRAPSLGSLLALFSRSV